MNDPYDQFLNQIPPSSNPPLVSIYHAVRNLPYGSIGQRDPADVLTNRRGSCSGKHLLLRNLLRRTGHEAHIITMFTHFESRLTPHPSFPPELNDLLTQGQVPDFHHYVRARPTPDSPWLNLDATWHDPLTPYSFPVNSSFDG
ncbi:MAG TPA: transglutaminase domain-containing protein, partial [Tepidisphaeraceae bacterium]|nr:transglutaminase domain-containing protein [Tepidisphaeraceae bacterium]